MEERGLAQQAAAQGTGGLGQQMPRAQEIAQLLLQGITPEELVAAGVPMQLIEQAIAIAQQMAAGGMEQQAQAGAMMGPTAAAAPEGLAAQGMM